MIQKIVMDKLRIVKESMFKNRIYSAIFISFSLIALGGCKTTTSGGAVGAKRSQLMLVSSQQLEQVAEQSYTKLKADAEQKGILNQDRAMLDRLLAITNRIKPHTATFRPDAPSWKWETNIISDKQLNAFCMPGGKIIFYSGLIDELKLTDDEIAVVLGHEVAHALREHSREQVSQAIAANTTISVGAALLGLSGGIADLAGAGYQALIATKFSRTDETEADRIGLELSARAGYDPRAGVTLWQKMMKTNGGQRPPEFLSSHPADLTRIQHIEKLLPTVMPLYEAARR
ncbi:M48 family metallopeptidase [Candidatus Nitrotoga sp. HW29]|uniref:M48 family metallopeptidase n=1 Tax=Candidatus Nitrotoga sp. HW29 TaxID=2886963 RepID=UPI001EF25266|nr:M48 family metallopeptidase [Candidatus Nitrotoga sp. HW29]